MSNIEGAVAAEASASERTDDVVSASERTEDGPIERAARKVRTGYVVSDKMDKTIVVAVEDRKKHALYGKVLRQTVRLKAHDEENTAGVGDRVRIVETRPLSKSKRWRLLDVRERAK